MKPVCISQSSVQGTSAYLQSVHCRFTPRSATGSVRTYPSSRARGFLPQSARSRTAHGNIFLPILYVVSRIITSQLSHAAADRCLQTSKPVSQALNVPIYAEHGEPIHASSRDAARLMGPTFQGSPNGTHPSVPAPVCILVPPQLPSCRVSLGRSIPAGVRFGTPVARARTSMNVTIALRGHWRLSSQRLNVATAGSISASCSSATPPPSSRSTAPWLGTGLSQ